MGATLAASVAIAGHEAGHSAKAALSSREVKVVRHSFPHPDYPGGQWETTTETWTTVPGASANITVPQGEKALIVVRFSPSVICSGTGICESRITINDVEAEPAKPVYFNPGSTNHWGVMYTERSLGPLPPGKYTVRGEVLTTFGTSGTTLYVRSFHLTVERFRQ
jgi:hypothetical protein